jgi:hypothetical protein
MSTVRGSADDFGKLLVRIALGLVLRTRSSRT